MLRPVLGLVLNAFVWGVSWWPFRWLESRGLHPLWSTALIYALAVAAITVVRPQAWRALLVAPPLWLVLLASGFTNATFNWAVTLGDVVRVVLLFYLMPVWAVLLARWLLGERASPAALLRAALAVAGAAIVLVPPGGAGFALPLPQSLADWLGVAGGFTFALNNVMLRREAARPESARALAMFAGGAIVSAALAAAQGIALPAAVEPGWLAGAIGLGAAFIAANLALQYGAARLPAQLTSVVMVSEVLFASASAVALGASRASWPLAAGGALIVGAALLAARE